MFRCINALCATRFSLPPYLCGRSQRRGFLGQAVTCGLDLVVWLLRTARFVFLGFWIPSGFSTDCCQQASEALQRRDLMGAEALLKLCLAASPAQLKP